MKPGFEIKDHYMPYKFYPMSSWGHDVVMFLLSDGIERVELKPNLLNLDVMSVDQLVNRNEDCMGYFLRPSDKNCIVKSSYMHVGPPSDPDQYTYYMGLPGLQLYAGTADVVVVSLLVSSYYELVEQTGEMGYESRNFAGNTRVT